MMYVPKACFDHPVSPSEAARHIPPVLEGSVHLVYTRHRTELSPARSHPHLETHCGGKRSMGEQHSARSVPPVAVHIRFSEVLAPALAGMLRRRLLAPSIQYSSRAFPTCYALARGVLDRPSWFLQHEPSADTRLILDMKWVLFSQPPYRPSAPAPKWQPAPVAE